MTELLNKYTTAIDISDFDEKHVHNDIRTLLNQHRERLEGANDTIGLKFFKLEHELHHITKSVENGLTPLSEGTRETEDGNTVKSIWPDFSAYTSEELDYFEKRYNETDNLYMKTEYGLVLFNSNRLQHHNQKLKLLNCLIEICGRYKEKFFVDANDYKMYPYLLCNRLSDALTILHRSLTSFESEFAAAIKLTEEWFLSWPIEAKEFPSICRFTIQSFLSYKKEIKNIIQIDKIIIKLDNAINQIKPIDIGSAISVAEEVIRFATAYKPELKVGYCSVVGTFYESIGDGVGSGGAVHEYESALVNFKSAKDEEAVERISKKIEENKGKFKLGTITTEANEEEVNVINGFINGIISKKSSDLIIACLSGYNILRKADDVYASADAASKSNSIMNFCTLQSLDKYGNTIRVYSTTEERKLYHLLSQLNHSHQMGVQIIFRILMRSLENEFFSFEKVKEALEKTWLNRPIEWQLHGDSHKTILLNSILPGIQHFFGELDKKNKDKSYRPNLILCSDSLALKIEMILRYFSKSAGKHTFRWLDKAGVVTSDEMPLKELLENLKDSLNVDDYMLIRYLLNEKGGSNIRNRIAHGLVEDDEYSPVYPLTILVIILRLSHYEFNNK